MSRVAPLLTLLLPSALCAQGIIVPRRCPVPVRCVPIVEARVERVSSDVQVTLRDGVLSFEIEEEFVNRGGLIAEADYLLPMPNGAAFQDLALEINGDMVTGETMDAVEARRIYEEIVRRQKDPALVEWMGQGLLRTRIFPIAAGERKRVQVRYQMVVQREGDALRVDHFRGRATQYARDGGNVREARERSRFTLIYPNDDEHGHAYSPTHELRIEDEGTTRRAEVRGNARDVTVLVPVRRGRDASITVLPHAPGRDDGFALITLAPPALPPRITPRDVTFVLDISGSMRGRKMEQARSAGKQLLATLSPRDRFRIIDFASTVAEFRDGFTQATPDNIRQAEKYLESLEPGGSTNISDALEAALEPGGDASTRLSLVLFVTDGEPTVGVRDPAQIAGSAERLRGGARLFTFGIGADVNVALLEQLALSGSGTATFVRPDEATERAVEVVANRLTSPVATSVRLRADGIRLRGMHPAGPYDLFAGQDLVILARYDGSGSARLRFEGISADGRVSWESTVDFPARTRENAFVPRLWATQRLGWLAAEKRSNGGSSEIDAEIRELGERYGIPTEFTSYFVPEPGLMAQLGATSVAPGRVQSPATAANDEDARRARFEAARGAAAQRQARTIAEVDQSIRSQNFMSVQITADSAVAQDAIRQAANRTFVMQNGVWSDGIAREDASVVRVQAFSPAYFVLIERLPELAEAFSLGDRVRIAGRVVVLEVGPDGVEQLNDEELRRIVANW